MDKEMETDEGDDETHLDYATQFLGFTPYSVFDEIFNIIRIYVTDIGRAVTHYLSSKFLYIPENQIQKGCNKLMKDTISVFEKNINRLELFQLRNVFLIPKHVLLPEDEVHRNEKIAATNEDDLNDQLRELRSKILHSVSNISNLRVRNDHLQSVLKRFRDATETFIEMDQVMKAAGVEDLERSVNEAIAGTRELASIGDQEGKN